MNGRMVTGGFTPAAKIHRVDADTTLIFLVGNGVWFLESTDDDWYGATNLTLNCRHRLTKQPRRMLWKMLLHPWDASNNTNSAIQP